MLLEIGVVRQREPLERGQDRDEIPEEAARAAADQLGDVGILFLRHDARPCRVAVGEFSEPELGARPQDELFREA